MGFSGQLCTVVIVYLEDKNYVLRSADILNDMRSLSVWLVAGLSAGSASVAFPELGQFRLQLSRRRLNFLQCVQPHLADFSDIFT